MKRKHCKLGALALAAAVAPMVIPHAVPAGHDRHYVTAQSRYGNGSATAPVAIIRGYPHVQLPSGWWQDCEGNCREALRRKHLDFWETINEEAPAGRR